MYPIVATGICGRVYQYFLKEFAVNTTKEEGKFYTPHDVVQLLAINKLGFILPKNRILSKQTAPSKTIKHQRDEQIIFVHRADI